MKNVQTETEDLAKETEQFAHILIKAFVKQWEKKETIPLHGAIGILFFTVAKIANILGQSHENNEEAVEKYVLQELEKLLKIRITGIRND